MVLTYYKQFVLFMNILPELYGGGSGNEKTSSCNIKSCELISLLALSPVFCHIYKNAEWRTKLKV